MKLKKQLLQSAGLLILLFLLSSCSPQSTEPDNSAMKTPEPIMEQNLKPTLPVQYQNPSYRVDISSAEALKTEVDDAALKVGANISSTKGPQPLWDILKRLAALKNLNVSWASDVDQNVLVDVDIKSNDDFYGAIKNLLRQVDYFHEMEGSTIVVKYKESRQYHIAMPYTTQTFETATGGNMLGSEDTSANVEGTIRLDSRGNKFDIWENIKLNLDTIMDKWSYRREGQTVLKDAEFITKGTKEQQQAARGYKAGAGEETDKDGSSETKTKETGATQKTAGTGYYIVDEHIGLITVTAPRPILEKVDEYFSSLKKTIYRQISIEAKIIEVQLNDSSSIGINWSSILKNFNINGLIEFGSTALAPAGMGQVWPNVSSDYNKWQGTSPTDHYTTNIPTHGTMYDPTRFVSRINLDQAQFSVFLNALKEQGDTQVLSNPKISILNGQPAMLTVGRNVTYIDSIMVDIDKDGLRTYSAETERILSGVGMALTANILNNNEIILRLVPVTSELEEPIVYRPIGEGEIGLPIVNVREMSTTVRVKSGEMLVIGGLISNIDETEGEFLPILGSIPIIRYLFGYETKVQKKRELIILLKPTII